MWPIKVVVITLIFLSAIASGHRVSRMKHHLHHKMDRADLEWYFGVSSPFQVPEYDIVSPVREPNEQGPSKRSSWYYTIPAFGQRLRLHVRQSSDFVPPGVVMETHHPNGSKTISNLPMLLHCIGHVISHPGSLVSISNINGLDGMIRLRHHTLHIRPLNKRLGKRLRNSRGRNLHILTRVRAHGKRSRHFPREVMQRFTKIRRAKRSAKQANGKHYKYLEMALVADNYAIAAIGERVIPYYLMMLAQLANSMYHDESIGAQKISIVIIKVVLKRDGLGYEKTLAKKAKLFELSKWARNYFPHKDSDGRHPDVIALITKGGTGGIADYRSACRNTFAFTVINDMGLGTSQVLAHETAHTLGVGHDGGRRDCPSYQNIMSHSVPGGRGALEWSPCSREEIQRFLSDDVSGCLDDPPRSIVHEPHLFHGKLPGQIYDRDTQCRLNYGLKYKHCKQKLSECGSLYCTHDEVTCVSRLSPPVDGTKCGDRHWCIKGECVDDGSSMIDGGWSPWSSYTHCTAACGIGVQWRTRTCTNPRPEGGGSPCEGRTKSSWRVCNPQDCRTGVKSPRQLQCDAVRPNSKAYIKSAVPCSLYCKVGSTLYLHGTVHDGIRCSNNPDVRDVCIQGVCKSVGCDTVLESGVRVDRCGVCNGDSTTCMLVKKAYTKDYRTWGKDNGDVMFVIPVGATDVFVQERGADHNLIATQDTAGRFLIEVPSYSESVRAAGTVVKYHREKSQDREWIYIKGPTTQQLRVMFLYLENGSVRNKGVDYQYYTPGKSTVTADQVWWKVSGWTACSTECAGGTQNRTVECIHRDDKTYVRNEVCERKERRPEKVRACNTGPCRPAWHISQWRPCSQTCGKGVQIRILQCRHKVSQGRYEQVTASRCRGRPPGPLTRECNKIACHPEWVPLAWGKCSKSCAGGFVTRELGCKQKSAEGRYQAVTSNMCRHAIRPPTKEPCNSDLLCPVPPNPNTGPVPRYKPLGCFRDGRPFALPVLVGSVRNSIEWFHMGKTVDACARLVRHRNPTYRVFGVKFYGECWSGKDAQYTYDEYGKDDVKKCYEGVGTHHNYYVYEFE